MNRADRPQSMGLWINDPGFADPDALVAQVGELADAGYGIVRAFVRESVRGHRDPATVALVRRLVDAAHARGLRLALDCEPHGQVVGRDMARLHPEAMGEILVEARAEVVEGRAVLRVLQPRHHSTFAGVAAAHLGRDGTWTRVEPAWTVRRFSELHGHGDLEREEYYRERVPGGGGRITELSATLPGGGGSLLVFARFAAPTLPDFWADGFRAWYRGLIDDYRDVRLDGIGWDEPAAEVGWPHYRSGAAFRAAFRAAHGRELADVLHLVALPGMSPAAVRARLDYYRTLNEGVARAQADLAAAARAAFGPDILLGTHHTWQGEGGINDLRAGAVDYFRLNDAMDAGYTDAAWWDPGSVAYAVTLASSLGRLTPSRCAEVNTWSAKASAAQIRRNVDLLTLMDASWFDLWYGSDYDTMAQRGDRTAAARVAAMRAHRQRQQVIAGRAPVVEVAVWHGWEGVCAWNQEGLANAHKACCIDTAELLLARGIAMDFVDSRLLAESRVVDGLLANRLGRYRVLVLPYALVLPRAAWTAVRAFAAAGGRVVFVATPVAQAEDGGDLAAEWAALMGVPAIAAEAWVAGIDARCRLPGFRPQRLEVVRPLPPEWPRVELSAEGEPHAVSSPAGNTTLLSDLVPGERLVARIAPVLRPDVQVFGEGLRWRRYGDDLLAVVSAEGRELRGIVRWRGAEIELEGGQVALIEAAAGGLRERGDARWRQSGRAAAAQ